MCTGAGDVVGMKGEGKIIDLHVNTDTCMHISCIYMYIQQIIRYQKLNVQPHIAGLLAIISSV